MNKKHYIVMAVYALIVMVIAHLYVRFDIAQREKFIRAETLMDEQIRIFTSCQIEGMSAPDTMARLIHDQDENHNEKRIVMFDARCMFDW